MSYSYDTSTDVGKVRLLIADTIAAAAIFQDEELQGFLDLEGGTILLAAADACEAIAAKISFILASSAGRGQKITIGNYSVSTFAGQQAATAFITQAKNLRARASGENDPVFAIAEQTLSTFNYLDMIRNWALLHSPLSGDIQ